MMSVSKMNSQCTDEHDDESWVIVKRQKINMLIPPPSLQITQCAIGNQHRTKDINNRHGSFVERSLPIVSTQFGVRWVHFLDFKQRIKKLGGMKTWLVSNGFERFVPVFEKEKLSLHQLFDVSMESLKKMGVMPVGPRRKLVHAIEMLSQPL